MLKEAEQHQYMVQIGQRSTTKLGAPYTWRNGLVCYKTCIVVSPNSNIITQLLQEFHDSLSGGHSRVS